MQKRQIINIVNFVRGYDPRTSDDLAEPVRRQLALMEQHRLKGDLSAAIRRADQSRFYRAAAGGRSRPD